MAVYAVMSLVNLTCLASRVVIPGIYEPILILELLIYFKKTNWN